MSQLPPSLVGAVVERAVHSRPSYPPATTPPSTGFPSVQHRSRSAFARARDLKRNGNQLSGEPRPTGPPVIKRSGVFTSDKKEEVSSAGSGRKSERGNRGQTGSIEVELPPSFPLDPPPNSLDVEKAPDSNMDDREWRKKMSQDNERTVEAMSEDERERHRKEVVEQLGPEIMDLIRKARDARQSSAKRNDVNLSTLGSIEETTQGESLAETTAAAEGNDKHFSSSLADARKKRQRDGDEIVQPTPSRNFVPNKLTSASHRGILVSQSPPGSRSSTPGRALRKLRFADVTDKDIHVFASEPSSPRRPIGLLLPPPEDSSDDDSKSDRSSQRDSEMELIEDIRRNHYESAQSSPSNEHPPDEGTPEDIRRRFFPNMQPHDPSVEWMEGDSSASSDTEAEPRFDLSGAIIPIAQRSILPTHLGLHHHAGPTSAAGYTLADLFHLARSTVAAQRATILGVLSKIIRRLAKSDPFVREIHKRRDEVRKDALAAGLAALAEKGSLGVQAVDLVWTCVVDWDQGIFDKIEGVELRPVNPKSFEDDADESELATNRISSSDPLSTLPLPVLLPQLISHVSLGAFPRESLAQLLEICRRLARHSVIVATAVTEFPQLISTFVGTFLLTPIPPSEENPLPNVEAIQLLKTLARSSRDNANSLIGPADALLRFITTATPPSNSPFPRQLAESLLCETLEFYTILAGYGLYTGVATTAADHFNRLSNYIFSGKNSSERLTNDWLRLFDAWMVAARDPHRTTPHHDLLWSQVTGWNWGEDVLAFRSTLLKRDVSASIWGSVWGAISSWLEGCRINSPKAGLNEQRMVSVAVAEEWTEEGVEKGVFLSTFTSLTDVVTNALDLTSSREEQVQYYLRLADLTRIILQFSRLVQAVIPADSAEAEAMIASPSPSSEWIGEASRTIRIIARSIASSLSWPGSPAFSKDEDFSAIRYLLLQPASAFLASSARMTVAMSEPIEWLPFIMVILQRLLPGEEACASWLVEEIIKSVDSQEQNCKGGLLLPFLLNDIQPKDNLRISPFTLTPESIQHCTSQCLPTSCSPSSTTRSPFSLPLKSDWPTSVLNHLLRSGQSEVFTNPDSLPSSWNASEVDLVQASLSLTDHIQSRLSNSKFHEFGMSCERVAFACMKVFMLEHDQQHKDSSEEVFRDPMVGRLMDDLLRPFTLAESGRSKNAQAEDLELVAKEYLGQSTPFFQFYTDFVALYDAISFSHKTFARLLLVPTSMKSPLDYRKHLWGDFGHVLRSIRIPIEDVIVNDLNAFLWPFETDAGMIGWYLRALVKWTLDGFLHYVAVHHVACNIWPDLQDGPVREKRAKMLLLAVVNQARPEVVKDVVRYTQAQGTGTRLPPQCFDCDEDRVVARLEYVGEWGGAQMMSKLEKIFSEK